MGERSCAEIRIGGALRTGQVRGLCQAIQDEGLCTDWGGRAFLPHTANDLLAACDEYEGSWILWLCNEQASWGTFEELEGYLRRVRIPFDRHTDSTAIYDGEWFAYRPGWGTATMTINQEGQAVVPIDGLRKVQRLLESACQATTTGKDPSRSLRRACRRMQRELPRPFPPLPSFTIGETSSRT